ncbi:MAG: hypothetical protein Q9161_001131 [Pseudevernia consocians]
MSRRPKARLHKIFQFFILLPYTTAESTETAAGSTETEARSNTMANNPKPNVAIMYNLLKPLPSQHQRRLETPRRAFIYLLSQTEAVLTPQSV